MELFLGGWISWVFVSFGTGGVLGLGWGFFFSRVLSWDWDWDGWAFSPSSSFSFFLFFCVTTALHVMSPRTLSLDLIVLFPRARYISTYPDCFFLQYSSSLHFVIRLFHRDSNSGYSVKQSRQ